MSDFLLSADARDKIRKILIKTTQIKAKELGNAVWFIDQSLANATILEKSGDPKASREELEALYELSIKTLEEIRALSLEGKLALKEFGKIQENAETNKRIVSNALSQSIGPKSRSVSFYKRSFALHLHEALEHLGIEPSTYDAGTYMSILRVVLYELAPTEMATAYRRHGLWVRQKVSDFSDVDLATMRIDSPK